MRGVDSRFILLPERLQQKHGQQVIITDPTKSETEPIFFCSYENFLPHNLQLRENKLPTSSYPMPS
jgi:hypothetical protein